MIDISQLERIINDQRQVFQRRDTGVLRDVDFAKYYRTKQITVISGIRRSGKSTLMRQLAEKYDKFYYLSFDDERLVNFSLEDFDRLMISFKKLYSSKVIFLDEIQNVNQWELFIRRIFEEGYKIFLTGSNAKLLSSELATRLTGRYLKIELYPFSFAEFLRARKINLTEKSSGRLAKILRYFDKFLVGGGFPEFVISGEKEILQRIYDDILYKDLLVRFKIKEVKSFKQLAHYLFSNIAKEISYGTLKNTLNFKSLTTVKNYIDYLEESYLLFELYKYDFSLRKQYVKEKKIYSIDNGLQKAVGFSFSENRGQTLENCVFIELKRRQKEVYFYKSKKECDFVIVKGNQVETLIQVTEQLTPQNEKRKIEGILEPMEKFNLKKGIVLTKNQEAERKINGRIIKIMPTWKWLLSN